MMALICPRIAETNTMRRGGTFLRLRLLPDPTSCWGGQRFGSNRFVIGLGIS